MMGDFKPIAGFAMMPKDVQEQITNKNREENNRLIFEFMEPHWSEHFEPEELKIPDYYSSDSPRRLLDEAEERAIEVFGFTKFHRALTQVMGAKPTDSARKWSVKVLWQSTPTDRSNAICALIREKEALLLRQSYLKSTEGFDLPEGFD